MREKDPAEISMEEEAKIEIGKVLQDFMVSRQAKVIKELIDIDVVGMYNAAKNMPNKSNSASEIGLKVSNIFAEIDGINKLFDEIIPHYLREYDKIRERQEQRKK